jgi:hypothetical protein
MGTVWWGRLGRVSRWWGGEKVVILEQVIGNQQSVMSISKIDKSERFGLGFGGDLRELRFDGPGIQG